jgi:anti-sigma factor (TIGR02949 family)
MSGASGGVVDCEKALRRLAEYLDRELNAAEGAEIEKHLAACRSCWSRAEFERGLKAKLHELRDTPVDPEFEAKICALARDFAK